MNCNFQKYRKIYDKARIIHTIHIINIEKICIIFI